MIKIKIVLYNKIAQNKNVYKVHVYILLTASLYDDLQKFTEYFHDDHIYMSIFGL